MAQAIAVDPFPARDPELRQVFVSIIDQDGRDAVAYLVTPGTDSTDIENWHRVTFPHAITDWTAFQVDSAYSTVFCRRASDGRGCETIGGRGVVVDGERSCLIRTQAFGSIGFERPNEGTYDAEGNLIPWYEVPSPSDMITLYPLGVSEEMADMLEALREAS